MTNKPLEQFGELGKIGDGVAITITIGTVVNILPAIVSILALIWWVIRIYETDTIQRWLGKRKKKDGEGKQE